MDLPEELPFELLDGSAFTFHECDQRPVQAVLPPLKLSAWADSDQPLWNRTRLPDRGVSGVTVFR